MKSRFVQLTEIDTDLTCLRNDIASTQSWLKVLPSTIEKIMAPHEGLSPAMGTHWIQRLSRSQFPNVTETKCQAHNHADTITCPGKAQDGVHAAQCGT